MRVQALERVCSIAHAHSFAAIPTSEAFATAVEDKLKELKQTSDGKHLLIVIGPNQTIQRDGINILRKKGMAKRLCVLDTGHGGETTLWLALNQFRNVRKALA